MTIRMKPARWKLFLFVTPPEEGAQEITDLLGEFASKSAATRAARKFLKGVNDGYRDQGLTPPKMRFGLKKNRKGPLSDLGLMTLRAHNRPRPPKPARTYAPAGGPSKAQVERAARRKAAVQARRERRRAAP